MYTKLLLIVLSAAAFSSCSTAYKSGQTPDDVYYSPLRSVDKSQDKKKEEDDYTSEDKSIRMRAYDRRWREFDNDYDYRNSPYNYCTCNCNNYGYYYNPYYYPGPVYTKYITPVNTTPRMVNLNAYKGLNTNSGVITKSGNVSGSGTSSGTYNNSNGKSGLGKAIRQIFSGTGNSNSSSSNNNRSYTPSNSGSSNSSSKPSSGSVTRPNRGG